MKKKLTIGPYLIKNPFLFLYLKCLDLFFLCIKFFKSISTEKNQVEKILVVQLAHKGDVIIATSILPLIKQSYPHAKIGILISTSSKDIIQNHPLIDCIHFFDHPKLNRSNNFFIKKCILAIHQLMPLVKEIKQQHYDVSIDLSCYYPNSHYLTWLCNIPRRIGYISGGGSPLLTDSIKWTYQQKHMSLYHLDLLKFLNIYSNAVHHLKSHLPNYSPHLFELLKIRYPIKEPFLIFHPYSGNALKHWSNDKWKQLTKSFIDSPYTILFTGGSKEERFLISNIIKDIPNAINLAGDLSFQELQALVILSSAVVSVDTMIGHLAANYDIPSVTLHSGIADPIHWKPASKNNKVINNPMPCFPCFRRKGCTSMACIQQISPELILEKLKSF